MWDLVGFHLNSWFVWHGNHPIDKWCCEGCVCLETVSCFHWCLHVSLSSFPPFFLTFIVVCSFNRFFFRMIFLHELGLSSLNKIVINLSVIVVAMSMISFILQRHFTKIYQFLSHNPCLFSSIFFRLFDLLFHHFFFSTSSSFFFSTIHDLFDMETIPLINDVTKGVFVWMQSPVSIDAFQFLLLF